MVDIELVALAIMSIIFLIGLIFTLESEYYIIFLIGMIGSGIDLIIHIFRLRFYSLPQIINGFDFANYYIFSSLLFSLIWYRSEGQSINTTTESVVILTSSIICFLSVIYMFTNDEFFLTGTLLFFSLLGVICSGYITINNFDRTHHLQSLIVIGGIILLISMLLYPTFLFSRILFLSSLAGYYIGWYLIVMGLIMKLKNS